MTPKLVHLVVVNDRISPSPLKGFITFIYKSLLCFLLSISWLVAGIWLLCGFFVLPPFFHLFNPLTLDRKERKKRKKKTQKNDSRHLKGGNVIVTLTSCWLGVFEFLGTSLIFGVRISSFFFLHCGWLLNELRLPSLTTTNSLTLGALAIINLLRSLQYSKCHTIAETICS